MKIEVDLKRKKFNGGMSVFPNLYVNEKSYVYSLRNQA
jgi:hypothetical protein